MLQAPKFTCRVGTLLGCITEGMTLQLSVKLFQVHAANKRCVPAFSLVAVFVQSDLGTRSAEFV